MKEPSVNQKIHSSKYYDKSNISLIEVALILARNLKIILVVPLVSCILTIIYVSYFANPFYTSTSKIMSSSNTGGLSQAAGLAAQIGINIPASQSEPRWVYPEIIKSRTLAKLMLKRKFDTNQFGEQKSLLQILTYGNQKPKMNLDTLTILAINKFLGMIDISEDITTKVLTLNITTSEPGLAADINRTLIDELDSHQRTYNRAKVSKTRQFIDERIISIERELRESEDNLKNFMDRNRRIENSPALQLKQQRLTREVTVLTGVFTTLKQQLETTKIEEVKESDYVITLDPPEIPLERSKPKKKMMVILAGMFGIGLGIVLSFINEYLRSREKEEMEKIIEIKSIVLKNIMDLIPGKSK